MLRSRAEIMQDKYFGPLTEAILERDQPHTTDLFYGMIARTKSWPEIAKWLRLSNVTLEFSHSLDVFEG